MAFELFHGFVVNFDLEIIILSYLSSLPILFTHFSRGFMSTELIVTLEVVFLVIGKSDLKCADSRFGEMYTSGLM